MLPAQVWDRVSTTSRGAHMYRYVTKLVATLGVAAMIGGVTSSPALARGSRHHGDRQQHLSGVHGVGAAGSALLGAGALDSIYYRQQG